MMCQLLLPFAHAAVMMQDASAAWCGSGPQPKVQWSIDAQADDSAEQTSKTIFCSVCAAASAHVLVPPTGILVLPLTKIDTVIQFDSDSAEFSYPSFAIPPPPRGPPLNS
jgi:hypothetical protein